MEFIPEPRDNHWSGLYLSLYVDIGRVHTCVNSKYWPSL